MDKKTFGILSMQICILKSYDLMCNYNIQSKQVQEKKTLASN